MMIGGWKCTDHHLGQPYHMREAVKGDITVTADEAGLEIDESYSGFSGASGRCWIPPNVLTWLMGAVR